MSGALLLVHQRFKDTFTLYESEHKKISVVNDSFNSTIHSQNFPHLHSPFFRASLAVVTPSDSELTSSNVVQYQGVKNFT